METTESTASASVTSLEEGHRSQWVSKEYEEMVQKVKNFQGLVCIVELEKGKIVYANDRVRYLKGIESESPLGAHFFHLISSKSKFKVIEKFREIHRTGGNQVYKIPVVVGPHEVVLNAEIITFLDGIVLKVSDVELLTIKEMEMEKLKVLILKFPKMGLWVTDEAGRIIDVLSVNCERNLGWKSHEVLGRNLSQFSVGERRGEEYTLQRIHKRGNNKITEVVEGSVCLSDGKTYYIYLDTYHRS